MCVTLEGVAQVENRNSSSGGNFMVRTTGDMLLQERALGTIILFPFLEVSVL